MEQTGFRALHECEIRILSGIAGLQPFAEVGLGIYFSLAVVYALQNENYATVPFLLLFVWGYLYTGLMSLAQTYFERLRFTVESPEVRPASTGAPGF